MATYQPVVIAAAQPRVGWIATVISILPLLALPCRLDAQELEPRALSNVPVGSDFLLVGYGLSIGNVLLDSALPVEDLEANLHGIVAAYVRAIDLLGQSTRISAIVPLAAGDWEAFVEGQEEEAHRTGLGDPRLGLSVSFIGAPALTANDMAGRQPSTVVGAMLQAIMPLGQYDSSRLLNLGSNRWTFKTQLGVSYPTGSWVIEGYGGLWLFTDNPDFYGGLTLEQRPLVSAKVHLVRLMESGAWLAVDLGYGTGGRTAIDGVARDTRISSFRFGLTAAFPLSAHHSIKAIVVSGARIEKGPDYDAVGLTYQYRWGGKP
jgi:hypothetical protein